MATQFNIETFFRDGASVAAVAPVEQLFGFMKRSLTLPNLFGAIVGYRNGERKVYPPGSEVNGADAVDVLLVQASKLNVYSHIPFLQSADKFVCDAAVWLPLRIPFERTELEAFRDKVMGSMGVVTVDAVEQYLRHAVDEALRRIAGEHNAKELVNGKAKSQAVAAIEEAIKGPCFAGGLALDDSVRVKFESQAFEKVRNAEASAAARLGEHQAQAELRNAIAEAQRERLQHLETMLSRLNELAEKSPEVDLPELMQAFDEAQRGQLYQALFQTRAIQPTTQWIVVAAGRELLFFDPRSPEEPVRRAEIDGPAGALRSVQIDTSVVDRDTAVLLIGAANGVYEMPASAAAPTETYLFDPGDGVRGGVNAVAATPQAIVATHSERGVLKWDRESPGEPVRLFADLTDAATAVRHAQFAAGRCWCSIDEKIVSVPAGDLQGAPVVLDGASDVIAALVVTAEGVFAGTADGRIVHWSSLEDDTPSLIHAGNRRAAESVGLLATGGVPRLYFSDTSTAASVRVLGDSFVCRYEAGGQTIRRAEFADDLIAGTTDARDRVIVWRPDQPARPGFVLQVSRLTGRSVQDVCLVPIA